jgi:uncharacterized protein (DUF2267 family)
MSAAIYNQALHRANTWLADVSAALGTSDRHYAQRVLRTWLHMLRDRLTVEAAVKFGQQLPELLRGIYYDGWEPSRVPVKYSAEQYAQRFASDSLVSVEDVPAAAAAVSDVMTERMSPGQVEEAFAELPVDLRATIRDGAPVRRKAMSGVSPRGGHATLDEQVAALGEAVRTLARGLEDEHVSGARVDQAEVRRAARLAEEILVAVGR